MSTHRQFLRSPRSSRAPHPSPCCSPAASPARARPPSPSPPSAARPSSPRAGTLNIDFATYNPLSLVIKDQGWLEEPSPTRTSPSTGCSRPARTRPTRRCAPARSTSARPPARPRCSPARTARRSRSSTSTRSPSGRRSSSPKDSPITDRSKTSRASRSRPPRAPTPTSSCCSRSRRPGSRADDVTVQNLQHADGWAALQNGSVDAWAGLDPIMAGAEEAGATLIYRNVDFNSYGFLNATESFIAEKPEVAQTVVERLRARSRLGRSRTPRRPPRSSPTSPASTPPSPTKVIDERTNLDVDNVPGDAQIAVLEKIGPIFVELGDVADAGAGRRRPRRPSSTTPSPSRPTPARSASTTLERSDRPPSAADPRRHSAQA